MAACMLVSTMASPIVVPDPISAIAFTTAGGLILVERKRAEYLNVGVPNTSDHIKIKIKMIKSGQEPPDSTPLFRKT